MKFLRLKTAMMNLNVHLHSLLISFVVVVQVVLKVFITCFLAVKWDTPFTFKVVTYLSIRIYFSRLSTKKC